MYVFARKLSSWVCWDVWFFNLSFKRKCAVVELWFGVSACSGKVEPCNLCCAKDRSQCSCKWSWKWNDNGESEKRNESPETLQDWTCQPSHCPALVSCQIVSLGTHVLQENVGSSFLSYFTNLIVPFARGFEESLVGLSVHVGCLRNSRHYKCSSEGWASVWAMQRSQRSRWLALLDNDGTLQSTASLAGLKTSNKFTRPWNLVFCPACCVSAQTLPCFRLAPRYLAGANLLDAFLSSHIPVVVGICAGIKLVFTVFTYSTLPGASKPAHCIASHSVNILTSLLFKASQWLSDFWIHPAGIFKRRNCVAQAFSATRISLACLLGWANSALGSWSAAEGHQTPGSVSVRDPTWHTFRKHFSLAWSEVHSFSVLLDRKRKAHLAHSLERASSRSAHQTGLKPARPFPAIS